jgi:hypothetical protein
MINEVERGYVRSVAIWYWSVQIAPRHSKNIIADHASFVKEYYFTFLEVYDQTTLE